MEAPGNSPALASSNLDKSTRQQIFAERVRAVGLEINKSAYKSATLGDPSYTM